MVNYYGYLWRISWPEMTATGAVVLFILCRTFRKFKRDWKRYKRWGRVIPFLRSVLWLMILGSYLLMFMLTIPDWRAKPGEVQGEVQGKTLTTSARYPYSIEIKVGAIPQTFWVDYRTFKMLNPGDRVILHYLPNRREVYQCEVLP